MRYDLTDFGLRQADWFHHFVPTGVWDAAPPETELLAQADKLVGGGDGIGDRRHGDAEEG
jgi:hypothetical protein